MRTLLQLYQDHNNQQLQYWLEQHDHLEQSLLQAMRYGLLVGGKRIRPFLVYSIGEMLGEELTQLHTPASAIECIHAYSLIHDDLPAMDDDDLRRGQPTCHVQFDEATAILAGDALQTLAFRILAEGELNSIAEPYRITMISELAKASGANGMCIGQALDLAAEERHITLSELETIHRHKTGALIECAAILGALACGEKGVAILPQLRIFAQCLGLAFQVKDDILDLESDTHVLGKPQGSDIEKNKSTYPSLLGIEEAKKKAEKLLQQALHALQAIPYNTERLETFARYVVHRDH